MFEGVEAGAVHRFFEACSDLLGVVDTGGRLASLNPAWERVLGHPLDALRGRALVDLLHDDDRPAAAKALADLALQGDAAFDARCRSADGSYRRFAWKAWPGGGGVRCVCARDITAEGRAQTPRPRSTAPSSACTSMWSRRRSA